MDFQAVLDQLQPLFRQIFMDDTLRIKESTTAEDVIGWDSLNHARLMVLIEEHFLIQFEIEDLIEFKNSGGHCPIHLDSSEMSSFK